MEKKEEIKGKLQTLTNETVKKIKEMKVEEVFNEAGLPTEQHKATLMRAVEAEMETFNTATNELITGEWT